MTSVRMGAGSPSARIMIVGEAWGETEERTGIPFSGASGQELNRMLAEAGILRSDCYVTNVVNARPLYNDIRHWIPETKAKITGRMVPVRNKFVDPLVAAGVRQLGLEIDLVKPAVIIALGGTALWALTGNESIVKWRGSLLHYDKREVGTVPRGNALAANESSSDVSLTRVVPTYHPAAILRMWDWRKIAIQDLKRAAREITEPAKVPEWDFVIKPSFEKVIAALQYLRYRVSICPTWIDLDLETKASHISCCGLSWSRLEAICIPFMEDTDRRGYWLDAEEAEIVLRLYELLTHRNCWVRGQNLLYDAQYTFRRWGFIPNVKQDTMIAQHVLWAGMPKSLAFQASMYSRYYVTWKPDKDTWKEGG